MKKLMAAAGVAVLAVGAWMIWAGSRAPAIPVRAENPGNAPIAAAPAEKQSGTAASPGERAAVDAPTPAPGGSLRIACRWGDDGTRAAGVELLVWSAANGSLGERRIGTGDDGIAIVAPLPAGRAHVQADRGGALRVDVAAGHATDAEFVIPIGIDVGGRVTDERGAPVANANVWLSSGARDYENGRFVACTDAAGRFSLRSVEPERFLGASAPRLRAAAVRPVRGNLGAEIGMELVLRDGGASLVGMVLDANNVAVSGARVLVGARNEPGAQAWDEETFADHRPSLEVVTDENGAFRVDGLEPGRTCGLWARACGHSVSYERVTLELGLETHRNVRLQRGARVAGRVTDDAGDPVTGATVWHVSTAPPDGPEIDLSHGPDWAATTAKADGDGAYVLEAIPSGTVRLCAHADDRDAHGEIDVAEGQAARWDPQLVEIAIRGRVLDARGAPLVGWSVEAHPPRGQGSLGAAKTDDEGRFLCARLARVPYAVQVWAAGDLMRARPAAVVRDVLPGGRALLVHVDDAAVPTAALHGTLLDTDGRPPARGSVRCAASGLFAQPQVDVDPQTGRFHIEPLPAGTYRLQGEVGGRRSAWSAPFTLAAGEARGAVALEMPVGGSVAITARGPDGAPLEGADVCLEESDGWSETCWSAGRTEAGRLRVVDIAPGSYRVRVGTRDLPMVYAPVAVTAARETEVAIDVPAGVALTLVHMPITETPPLHETFVWTCDGALWERYTNLWEVQREMRQTGRRFAPGAYEVVVTSETGRRAVTRFVVAPGDPADRAVAIRMP